MKAPQDTNLPAAAAKAPPAPAPAGTQAVSRQARITSIDALRGFVMFTMIYVNDLAGAPGRVVPAWMKHFHGRSGMTFVDLVFPAFLFIVGMSIPFALGGRLKKGEGPWKTLGHVAVRTSSLLLIGILMVNETPDSDAMGWSGELWTKLMFLSAILAFCSISPARNAGSAGRERVYRWVTAVLRGAGLVSLVWLAFAFRGRNGRPLISLDPFSIHTEWYGILGLIGWSYLVGSVVFLLFRGNRTALLGCMVLLLCLYPADRHGMFENSWLSRVVGIGEVLGAHPSITVAGVLLASMLSAPDMAGERSRCRFTIMFAGGCAAAALLLNGLYGISKNNATPSWCLWACAITALLWLPFHFVCDVRPVGWVARPLAVAGQNVLLAYLFSEMLPSAFGLPQFGEPTLGLVVLRSAGYAFALLCLTAALNRAGFRLKL